MFTKNATLIIPTRNRAELLEKTLRQIKKLKVIFYEIIVVDSSDIDKKNNLQKICKKFNAKFISSKASSSFQRNVGLKCRNLNTKFVMFLDDDVIFFKNTFKEMNKTIKKYHKNKNVVGFCFNQVGNLHTSLFEKIKTSKFVKKINLYSNNPGQITKSGWHTKILNVKKDTLADWSFTTASIYKSENIINKFFDTTFGSYSYLEDLEFSLKVTLKKKHFVISSKAKFQHPINIDRSSFLFGKAEVINRYKIVLKYRLSGFFFFTNVVLRFFISLLKIFLGNINSFKRALGNIYAIVLIVFKKAKIAD